jgi:hypothetical protein
VPYDIPQSVIFTQSFERDLKACGVDEDELREIVDAIAEDPTIGDLISGTGGARKVRHRSRSGGKSGGYRTIHYFGGDDIPIFLLTIYTKSAKASLTRAERNHLAEVLPRIGNAYRQRRQL